MSIDIQKHKISVLTWCFSRQSYLDQTIGRWLAQTGVDFEVVLGHGPDIRWKPSPLIVPVPTPRLKMCESYNLMLKHATGDLLLLTQCDILPRSNDQLAHMLARYHPGAIVSERFFKQAREHEAWYPQQGIFLQCILVAKRDIEDVGGWWVGWDDPAVCAHEDGDIICSLLERGLTYQWMETPVERGVVHLFHIRPDYVSPLTKNGKPNPYNIRCEAGKKIFWTRHDKKQIKELMHFQWKKLEMQRKMGIIDESYATDNGMKLIDLSGLPEGIEEDLKNEKEDKK